MNYQAQAIAQTQQRASTVPSVKDGILQRQCACGQHAGGGECEECRKKREGTIQRAAMSPAPVNAVPPIVHDVLNSPGQPLGAETRAFMEPRFGYDFSGVRVHSDERAAESAQAVNALAYTVGQDVVFRTGQYAPETGEGRRLLAHELTHVVQQTSNISTMARGTGAPRDLHESEAERVASIVSVGQRTHVKNTTSSPLLQFQEDIGERTRRFTADGVSIVVRRSCAPNEFGFDEVEEATQSALDKIFNSDCIAEDRRIRIQKNLTRHGLDIRCAASSSIDNDCAEATGYFIPANITTLGSRSFPHHPDSSSGCQPLESIVLHEIVHLTRGFYEESLPDSCEVSCFGTSRKESADLCQSPIVGG